MQFRWHQATLMRTCYCSLCARNNVVLYNKQFTTWNGGRGKDQIEMFCFCKWCKILTTGDENHLKWKACELMLKIPFWWFFSAILYNVYYRLNLLGMLLFCTALKSCTLWAGAMISRRRLSWPGWRRRGDTRPGCSTTHLSGRTQRYLECHRKQTH